MTMQWCHLQLIWVTSNAYLPLYIHGCLFLVYQECPSPPRLQEQTWRKSGVLTWFLMSDLHETFTEGSNECTLKSDTISKSTRNVHFLLTPVSDLEDR